MKHEIFQELRSRLAREELAAVATVVSGSGLGNQLLLGPGQAALGSLGTPGLDQQATEAVADVFQTFGSKRVKMPQGEGEVEIFFDVYPPPEKLVIVGAVHVAIHLIDFARIMGFSTIVVDPRTAFATPERFARADRLIAKWPAEALSDVILNESTFFVTLSHDFKIDLPALEIALASPARYIGALGSKRTHKKRVDELLERGNVSASQIDRIHAPVGLNLGGRKAEEIALAVIAEIQAARHGQDP